MNIAICDDEDIFRKHFRELLLKESFVQNTDIQVWECASGEELLAACSEAGFHADVIFLDIRMKGMDGMETARILRRRGEKCLLVFLTSLSEYAAKGYEVKAFQISDEGRCGQRIGTDDEGVCSGTGRGSLVCFFPGALSLQCSKSGYSLF